MLRLALLLVFVLFSSDLVASSLPGPRAVAAGMLPQIAAATLPQTPAVRPPLRQTIQVEAAAAPAPTGESPVRVTSAQMQTTAGTLEDPARYFQVLPGVQSDSDQRNDFLVRGGNPSENLFVLDGIEVPSINHLALSDTTGGLVSMIDATAIESMTLHAGVHDARFDDRLSSVVEISTASRISAARPDQISDPGPNQVPDRSRDQERDPGKPRGGIPSSRRIVEAGIAGAGGIFSWKTGPRANGESGAVLVSVREGILNLLTSNIGLNGVPKYTNALMRADRDLTRRDKLWGVSLTGVDSIKIAPDAADPNETDPFNIGYSGWRNTTGANWQHIWSSRTFGVLTLSNAEQAQKIAETDQLLSNSTTYAEDTLDGDTTGKYEVTSQPRPCLLESGGASVSVKRVDYTLAQPMPLPSPYSASPAPNPDSGSANSASLSTTVTSLHAAFSTPVDSGFAQATFLLPAARHLSPIRLTAATRVTHWGFDGHTLLTPRALVAAPLGGSRLISAGYAEYAQMPAFLYQLAYPQNHALIPIRARHLTLDLVDLVRTLNFALQLAAYDKRYSDYPVASGYPQLSLANIADTFGQSFPLFPMISKGRGRADGVEATLRYRPVSRLTVQGSVAYARSLYSGLDGILRPGNFDIPFSAKLSAVWDLGRGVDLSVRYDGASGRPYTPDNMAESYAQDRDVYDLTRINGARSHAYGRLDLRIGQTRRLGAGWLSWHAGLENALNQKNFYEYLWQPRMGGVSEQDQMPIFPDGGIKYTF